MAQHNTLGQIGEEKAVGLLVKKGYTILHRNWRFKHKEIDIIAKTENYLVIVEVKTRKGISHEEAWQAVTNQKIRFLADATEAYIKKYKEEEEVRFDVVSVLFEHGNFMIEHIEDAFRPWM